MATDDTYGTRLYINKAALRNVFPDLRLRRSFAANQKASSANRKASSVNKKASTDAAEGFIRCCGMLLLKKPSEDAESF